MTNGLSHPYHLCESIFIFRRIGSNVSFLFHLSMKIMSANRTVPDGTPRFAASHLGLFCLHISHKQDARFIWVKQCSCVMVEHNKNVLIVRTEKTINSNRKKKRLIISTRGILKIKRGKTCNQFWSRLPPFAKCVTSL